MAEVVLDKICKTFGTSYFAIKDLSLTIMDGEFLILVGPSGCGKSTALRMIAGLEKISSGTLTIGGEDVADLAPKDRDIAMVFLLDAACRQKQGRTHPAGAGNCPHPAA